MKSAIVGAFALATTLAAGAAFATTVTTTSGILPSFTGTVTPDLEVQSASAVLDGAKFVLTATLDGAPGSTTGEVYVWGINTGSGADNFASLGQPGVIFSKVIAINPAKLASGQSISGDTITDVVSSASLGTTGFAPSQFRFNFWPVGPGTTGIPEFAPNNSTFTASSVPEPGSWAIMLVGLGALGAVMRHTQRKSPVLV